MVKRLQPSDREQRLRSVEPYNDNPRDQRKTKYIARSVGTAVTPQLAKAPLAPKQQLKIERKTVHLKQNEQREYDQQECHPCCRLTMSCILIAGCWVAVEMFRNPTMNMIMSHTFTLIKSRFGL